MKKYWLLAALCGLVCLSTAIGQDSPNREGRPDGPGPDGPPRQREGFRPPPNPIIEALDADRDHSISAEEIQSAATALKTLDHNGDGQLSKDEFHPAPPRGRDGGPPDARPEDGDRGRNAVRGRDAQPPPRERNRDGRRNGPPDGGPEARGPDADSARPPEARDGGDDRPRGPGARGEERRPREDGPPPPPSPERMIEHAMEFDANGDGSLNREELLEFARQMPPPNGGPEGGPDSGRAGRRAPDDGPPAQGGDRPQRPRRPE